MLSLDFPLQLWFFKLTLIWIFQYFMQKSWNMQRFSYSLCITNVYFTRVKMLFARLLFLSICHRHHTYAFICTTDERKILSRHILHINKTPTDSRSLRNIENPTKSKLNNKKKCERIKKSTFSFHHVYSPTDDGSALTCLYQPESKTWNKHQRWATEEHRNEE